MIKTLNKMSINETVKSFLLHKHHEFAEKTRIGRAAERIWVKHQFKEKGILNPQNYSQKEMNMFYSVIAANYVHLHEAFPQVFDTARVYDAKILGLEPGKTITNADLYLTRVRKCGLTAPTHSSIPSLRWWR